MHLRSMVLLLGACCVASCGDPANQLDNDFAEISSEVDTSGVEDQSEADNAELEAARVDNSEDGETSETFDDEIFEPDEVDQATIATQIGDIATPLSALGSEPFWTAEIAEDWIVLVRSGLPEVDAPFTGFVSQAGGSVKVDSPPLDITIKASPCADPATGVVNPFQISILFEDVTYRGCASKGANQALDVDDHDWSGLASESIAAIDACLTRMPSGSIIDAVYPREEDTLGIVMRDPVGNRKECGVSQDGKDISFLDTLRPGSELPWTDSEASFSRGADIPALCQSAIGREIRRGSTLVGYYFEDGCAL